MFFRMLGVYYFILSMEILDWESKGWLLVRDTPPTESIFCVLEQTLDQLLSNGSTQ